MLPNLTKQALAEGKLQLGVQLAQFRWPEIVRLMRAAGFDWAFIDAEHGNFTIETLQDLCRTSLDCGLTPVVRVADLQYAPIARALDSNAQGIILPRVESPELLAKAVSWTRYPPAGQRGFGLGAFHVGYEAAPIPAIMDHMNRQTLVVLQIETVRAFEARHELLSVPGVDAVLIGPADFSISLGIGGEFQNPLLISHIDRVMEACADHKIFPGIHTRNAQLSTFWRDRGMKLLSTSSDIAMLWEKAAETVKSLRG